MTTPKPGFERLKAGGRLVVYGFAEMLRRGVDRQPLWRLPTRVFPLERAAEAHAALESGKTVGKLVLRV